MTTPHASALGGVLRNKCLTMTYFHRRPSTIIGAKAFHGPVRDGKAWDHLAMVVKRNWFAKLPAMGQSCQLGSEARGLRGSARTRRCARLKPEVYVWGTGLCLCVCVICV